MSSYLLLELVDKLLSWRGEIPLEQLQLGLVSEPVILELVGRVERRRINIVAGARLFGASRAAQFGAGPHRFVAGGDGLAGGGFLLFDPAAGGGSVRLDRVVACQSINKKL